MSDITTEGHTLSAFPSLSRASVLHWARTAFYLAVILVFTGAIYLLCFPVESLFGYSLG